MLPEPIEAAREGWRMFAMTCAFVVRFSLFWGVYFCSRGIQVLLYATIQIRQLRHPIPHQPSSGSQVVRAFGYIGLSLNFSTVVSATLVILLVNELPSRAWRKWGNSPIFLDPTASESELFKLAGVSSLWPLGSVHFVISFALGSVCTLVHVGLMSWMHFSSAAAHVLVAVSMAWMFFPIFAYLLSSFLFGVFRSTD
jgi:hypothetical protein